MKRATSARAARPADRPTAALAKAATAAPAGTTPTLAGVGAGAAAAAGSPRRRRVQSAEVGMGLLKVLARLGGAASLTAVAQAVGEPTAKVHRYMASLMQEGLVAQDAATQRYVLGHEAITIGLAALRQCDPARVAEPALVRLREELAVTCFLAVLGNQGPTIIRIEEPALPVTVNVRAGSVLPLLWSATGQVFLAYLNDATLRQRATEEWATASLLQKAGLPDLPALDRLQATVRTQGCAVVRDSLLPGISAVAAPIFNHSGRVVAVLTALGASGGFDPAADGVVGRSVCAQAQGISRTLGKVVSGV